jgi:putative transposase
VARAIFRSAQILEETETWQISLMLLMPDHLHALIAVSGAESLGRIVGAFKRATVRFAAIEWQKNFFDHRLRSSKSAARKHDYILQNPVRAGLVSSADSWPYQIARAIRS